VAVPHRLLFCWQGRWRRHKLTCVVVASGPWCLEQAVAALSEGGADLTALAANGWTALHVGAFAGHALVAAVLASEANQHGRWIVDTVNRRGWCVHDSEPASTLRPFVAQLHR
jgi:hypothetical protein